MTLLYQHYQGRIGANHPGSTFPRHRSPALRAGYSAEELRSGRATVCAIRCEAEGVLTYVDIVVLGMFGFSGWLVVVH